MRLTLRTLLAWMDGVLAPAEQRQLGEKVEESAVARKLVERIGACVANPHLSAPRIDGKGLGADPDSVAEYLDNTLAADRLEAFETICLESDVHLAEVAACHAILAEVAKHPEVLPPLDPGHRRRLLEAMQHRVAAHPHLSGPPRDRREAGVPSQGAAPSGPTLPAPRDRAPAPAAGAALPAGAPHRRTPWGAWALAGSALLLLGVLTALLVQSAGLFRRQPRPAGAIAGLDAAKGDAADGPDAPRAPLDAAAEPVADVDPGADAGETVAAAGVTAVDAGRGPPRGLAELLAAADAADATADAPTASVQPLPGDGGEPAADGALGGEGTIAPPGDDTAVDAAPTPDPGPRKVRAGDALAIAGGARPRRPAGPAPAAEGNGIATEIEGDLAAAVGLEGDGGDTSLGFVAADGLLLRRVAAGDRSWWVPIGVGTPLRSGETLVVPPGMHPELNLAGVSLRVLSRSVITLDTDAGNRPRVGLIEGRVVARSARGDARLGIVAGGIAGELTAGLDGAVTVERRSAWTPGLGEAPAAVVAELFAVGRDVHFRTGDDGAEVVIPARGGLHWESTASGGVAPLAPGRVPSWGTGAERIDPLMKNAAETFVARLATLPEAREPAAALDEVTLAMAVDRRVENRIFAATLLALEGSFDVAVELLCEEAPGKRLEGRQWQALEAVVIPVALARGPESAARLRKAWEDRGPPGRAEMLMAMARGPDDADLAAGAGRTLVEALSSTELVVRRYALKNLVAIVEPSVFDRARFRPDGPDEARRDGIAWWRALEEKGMIRRDR